MMLTKRKVSVSLDEDLLTELEATGQAVSPQVNDAVREALERRRRQHLLASLLDRLDEEHGPVGQELIAKYAQAFR